MIRIDGSYLEGGGSIARIALALSAITQKSFTIADIRKNRPQPGLKNQHLFCIRALEQLCNAKAEGSFLGSQELKFVPGKLKAKNLEIDIETAGSIPLFLQSILLPLMFADKPSKITIKGGTSGKWAAPIEYFDNVFLPQIRKYAKIELKTLKRGYFPKGQGLVEIKISPIYKLNDFNFFDEFLMEIRKNATKIMLEEHGRLIQIKGISHASMDIEKAQVAERQAKAAQTTLTSRYSCPIAIQTSYSSTASTGSGITLWAIFSKDANEIDERNPIRIGADALGERGKSSDEVGYEAAKKLIGEIESKAPVDSHLADQLLPFLALFGGKIRASRLTSHSKTNIYTIEKFLGKCLEIDEKSGTISANF